MLQVLLCQFLSWGIQLTNQSPVRCFSNQAICLQQTSNGNQGTLELTMHLPWLTLEWTRLWKLSCLKNTKRHPKTIAAPVPITRNLGNESPVRYDSRSTAQSPFEIFEAGLPCSSLQPCGEEARPPPGAPGFRGAKPNCWGRPKYPGGLRPV